MIQKLRFVVLLGTFCTLLFYSCNDCQDVPYPPDFTTDDYKKYPVFDIMAGKDTIIRYYIDVSNPSNIDTVTAKWSASELKYAQKSNPKKCYIQASRQVDIHFFKRKGNPFESIFIYKTLKNPDITIGYRYIGDSTILGVKYSSLYGLGGIQQQCFAYFTTTLGMICYKDCDSGEIFKLK